MVTMFGGLQGSMVWFFCLSLSPSMLTLDMLTSQIEHSLQAKRVIYRGFLILLESQRYLKLNKDCKSHA